MSNLTKTSPRRAAAFTWVAVLALATAAAAPAVVHNVDFGAGCQPAAPDCSIDPCIEINATVGVMLNDTIQGINTGGGTPSWVFDVEPFGCTGSAPTFTCNGVVIDASGDPVTVSGTPTSGGSFTFALEGDTGTDLCYGGFELIINDPFDIVMVLDRSGSMTSTNHILPPASSRYDALKRAVNNLTPTITAASCAENSRAGLTFFSTNVLANNSFPAGLTAVGGTLANDVNTEMGSQEPPGGLTALGSGVQDGIGKLTDAARKRVVMVFSDGEQNQDPRVNPANGTEYLSGGSPSGTIAPGGSGAFKIVSIGIGNPMNSYHDALSRLGNNNNGSYLVTATGEDITMAMDAATADLLDGCSPQLVATYSGELAGTVSLSPFEINRKVRQMSIRLSVDRDFEVPQLVQLLVGFRVDKDGTDVTRFFRPVIVGNFTNTITLQTDFSEPTAVAAVGSSIPPDGTYTVTLVEPANVSPTLDYRAVVFADDQRLDMSWDVAPDSPRAGGSFEPSMVLSWFSEPVTGATVEAYIRGPKDDVGDALARDPLRVDPSGADDAGSPGEQKFQALLEDADFLAKILPQEQQLVLTDNGDGTYSGSFSPGDVSGIYQVIFRVSADDPARFGRVQRLAMKSVHVRPNELDLEASGLSTQVDGNTIVWQMRPITIDGRFWGPAQAGSIRVDGAGVKVTDIADDQFGGYTITLTGDPGSDVTVSLGDDEIYTGPAGEFGPESGRPEDGKPRWLFWLIVLIIVLIVLWLLKKVFK